MRIDIQRFGAAVLAAYASVIVLTMNTSAAPNDADPRIITVDDGNGGPVPGLGRGGSGATSPCPATSTYGYANAARDADRQSEIIENDAYSCHVPRRSADPSFDRGRG